MKTGLTALVVDDSSSMRHYVATILREKAQIGNVLEAIDGDDAIQIIRSSQHYQIGCIFLDVEMPGVGTDEILAYIRNNPETANVPCILLTAKQPQDAEKIATANRADDFICKPFTPDDLLQSWMRVLVMAERRRGKRSAPPQPCEIDLGFDNYNHYGATLLNISATGCLIRTGILGIGAGHIYDIGSIIVNPGTQDAVELCGRIIRIQADKSVGDSANCVLIAFEFNELGQEKQQHLNHYILTLD
jgi:CheY-like chemotaxis protein